MQTITYFRRKTDISKIEFRLIQNVTSKCDDFYMVKGLDLEQVKNQLFGLADGYLYFNTAELIKEAGESVEFVDLSIKKEFFMWQDDVALIIRELKEKFTN